MRISTKVYQQNMNKNSEALKKFPPVPILILQHKINLLQPETTKASNKTSTWNKKVWLTGFLIMLYLTDNYYASLYFLHLVAWSFFLMIITFFCNFYWIFSFNNISNKILRLIFLDLFKGWCYASLILSQDLLISLINNRDW